MVTQIMLLDTTEMKIEQKINQVKEVVTSLHEFMCHSDASRPVLSWSVRTFGQKLNPVWEIRGFKYIPGLKIYNKEKKKRS